MTLEEYRAKNRFESICNDIAWLENHGFISHKEKLDVTMWAQNEIINITRDLDSIKA